MKLRVVLLLSSILSLSIKGEDHIEPITNVSFGSCHKAGKNEQIFERISATNPQFFLWLGDNIYADTLDRKTMRKKYDKLNAILSYQRLKENTKIYAIWDDHDYGVNDAGAEYPKKRESKEEFLRAFTISSTDPVNTHEGIYRSYTHGPQHQRVQFILLDTRYFRSSLRKKGTKYLPDYSSSASMLGNAQWQWLEKTLQEPAHLRILCTSIQLIAEEHRFEKWANMPTERARLLHLLRNSSGRTLVLSGDRHFSEFSRHKKDRAKDIWEITSSGLTQAGGGQKGNEQNQWRVNHSFHSQSFGTLKITWDQSTPTILATLHNNTGESCSSILLKPNKTDSWKLSK